MKKNEYTFNLTIRQDDIDNRSKLVSHSNDMLLSIRELAELLHIETDDCTNRLPKDKYKIGVFPGYMNDDDDSLLSQVIEEQDGYSHVYTWESFATAFPEAENVDWEIVYAVYRKEVDKDTSNWRNHKSLYILRGDGTKDLKQFSNIFNSNSITISWNDLLKKFNCTAEDVLECAPYSKYLPESHSYLRSAIREGFVDNLLVQVVPDNTPISSKEIYHNIHLSDWLVITWSDFIAFFGIALDYDWDKEGMPLIEL